MFVIRGLDAGTLVLTLAGGKEARKHQAWVSNFHM